jgi:hypothetical protein
MFKVATNKYEDQQNSILPGDFSYAANIIKAYPMLSWIGEVEMDSIMRDVLFDTIVNGECLQSFYEKYAQNGISPAYCEEWPDSGKCKPNEEQLEELRKYDSLFLIYEA